MNLLYGLIAGILFGFIMQRARVIRYDKQIGALLLQDMTIVKFMFTAILVGMAGIYLLGDVGYLKISGRPLIIGATLIGGGLFGIGWALLGYCPGTSWGALGEGRLDALVGILGLFAGAFIYAEIYPFLAETVLTWGNMGNLTIPDALGINHWFVIAVMVAGGILMFRWLEKKGL
ncbi:MAG TPA: YeeE/YedE thiosulfate transporter family protein [Syntrophomonas sp.]|nr:YeeE/YedE thiosulfate transporter family protein [Syntrophomonas sp.]HRW13390.1 YeeE/YedE thiosulfate transporter family protein [Syntrophomonas sp.]